MKKTKPFFTVFGFVFGLAFLLLDRWLDIHNHSFMFSWSVVVLVCTIFGAVIDNLLKRVFNEQRKRAEAIEKEHKRLQELFSSLPGIVLVLEESRKVRFTNRNSLMEFGECEGEFCYEVLGRERPCDNCLTERVFVSGLASKSDELVLNNRIYEVILQPFTDVDGSRLVINTLYDVTDRRKAEQELSRLQAEMAHLERLNLVGQMAAGLAHEIRNPMTTVRGYLQLLGAKPEFQAQGSTFELLIGEIDRVNSIITEFLSLVRSKPTERQHQNINEILRHLYPLLEADAFTQTKQIVLEAGETPDVLLSTNEISQLVLNLCRNGLEAMQMGETLTISTYVEDKHVVLSVEDEGCGIDLGYLDKLGTPFFTTKEKGTGLGLATCYSIVDRHHATIDVKSDPEGTTFFVRFPCLTD